MDQTRLFIRGFRIVLAHVDARFNHLEDLMTDLHAELTETESGLSSDLDAIAAKLDSADANTLTQADVDAVAALKAKADALITAAPVEPTDTGTAVPNSTTDTTTEDDTATA